MSAKRQREARIYARKRKAFLADNAVCWVWIRLGNDGEFDLMRKIWDENWVLQKPSSEVHHTCGRTGTNYLDEATWMAVSAEGHRFIHENPKEAVARGWVVR